MTSDGHQLTTERQLGSEQGEAFDRRLRERELAGREERVSRRLLGLAEPPCELESGPLQPQLGSHDLQSEVERLRAYYHAVQRSRAWRLTQRLRGVVGRAW